MKAEAGVLVSTNMAILALAVLVFLGSRVFLLTGFEARVSDLGLYYQYTLRAIEVPSQGVHSVPYEGDFKIEYPPVAWWTIKAPRFGTETLTRNDQIQAGLKQYEGRFRFLMFLCDAASFGLVVLTVRRRRPELMGWAAMTYAIALPLLAHLFYDRLDAGMALIMSLWAFFWTKSLDDSKNGVSLSLVLSYAMIGLGISYKIIPAISVPYLLLAELYAARPIARIAWGFGALALTACGPFALQYAISGEGVFALFKIHSGREIQLESIYATAMWAISYLGPKVYVNNNSGAFNLHSDAMTPIMMKVSSVCLIGFLAALGIWAFFQFKKYSRRDAYRYVCYLVPGAVILSKVLSPQYFVFAFPLLILLGAELFSKSQLRLWILCGALIVIAYLTTWIFPNHYSNGFNINSQLPTTPYVLVPDSGFENMPDSPVAYIVLAVRNMLYLGLIVWLGVALLRSKKNDILTELSGAET